MKVSSAYNYRPIHSGGKSDGRCPDTV